MQISVVRYKCTQAHIKKAGYSYDRVSILTELIKHHIIDVCNFNFNNNEISVYLFPVTNDKIIF